MQQFDQNKLDLFLRDELNAIEKENFIQEMENNPSLKEEVLVQQELVQHLNHLGDLELRGIVKDVHQQAILQEKPKNKSFLKILFAIISLALLGLLYFLINQAPKNEKLYQAYYASYDKLSFTSRSSETIETQIGIAADFYAQKDYQQALPVFKKIMTKKPNDARVCMAIGICEMELNQFQSALSVFDKLIQKNDRLYYYQAVWYSALIYLHEDKLQQCISYLDILANQPDAFFHKEAKELLSKID